MSIILEDRPTDEWMLRNKGNALTHTTLRDGREVQTVIQKTFITNYDIYYASNAPEIDHRAALERLAQGYYAFNKQTGSERYFDTYIPPVEMQERKNLYTFLLNAMKIPYLSAAVWFTRNAGEGFIPLMLKDHQSSGEKVLNILEEAMKKYDDENR